MTGWLFFSYFGGKMSITHLYPRPKYQTIVEPFAGAASYATRYPSHRVILVEKNPVVAALWKWLIRVSPKEVLSLPIEIDDLRTMPLTPEQKTLIGFWLNPGSPAPKNVPSTWWRLNIKRTPGGVWSAKVRARLARQVELIRHWRVVEGDYSLAADLVGKEEDATWFVDPPYHVTGEAYPESSRNIDFEALGRWCQARKGQVIVCENEGADWLPFRPLKSVVTQRRRSGKRSREVVWISGEEWTPRATLFSFPSPHPIIHVKRIIP